MLTGALANAVFQIVTLLMPLCKQKLCCRELVLVPIKAAKDLKEKVKQSKFSSSCACLKRNADPTDKLFFVQIRLDFQLVGFSS